MDVVINMILIFGLCLISSMAHEADMRRSIKKYGHTGGSGWLGRIRGIVEE